MVAEPPLDCDAYNSSFCLSIEMDRHGPSLLVDAALAMPRFLSLVHGDFAVVGFLRAEGRRPRLPRSSHVHIWSSGIFVGMRLQIHGSWNTLATRETSDSGRTLGGFYAGGKVDVN